MRLDKLPVAEAIVGFLLVTLVVVFIIARDQVSSDEAVEEVASPTEPGPTATPGELELTMDDNSFDQTELTVAAGADVTIPLTNNGVAVHNVHIALNGEYAEAFCEVGGDNPCSDPERIAGGDIGTLAFLVPNAPGEELEFRCDFHPTEMTGTIKIQ